jgi:hypothetical protein
MNKELLEEKFLNLLDKLNKIDNIAKNDDKLYRMLCRNTIGNLYNDLIFKDKIDIDLD